MKKRLPKMKTNRAAERLLSKDLSDYLHKGNFSRVSFEFDPKDKNISLRISESLLKAIKLASETKGISYQKFIREAVEESLRKLAA